MTNLFAITGHFVSYRWVIGPHNFLVMLRNLLVQDCWSRLNASRAARNSFAGRMFVTPDLDTGKTHTKLTKQGLSRNLTCRHSLASCYEHWRRLADRRTELGCPCVTASTCNSAEDADRQPRTAPKHAVNESASKIHKVIGQVKLHQSMVGNCFAMRGGSTSQALFPRTGLQGVEDECIKVK